MGSIGATSNSDLARIGIATTDGRAYYAITSFLKRIGFPFNEIVFAEGKFLPSKAFSGDSLIITTRKERLFIVDPLLPSVICFEDLSKDPLVAKERLLSRLYQPKEDDLFVVGIDPGQRTGFAAFINHREIESGVVMAASLSELVARVRKLLDNAPEKVRKRIIKIGDGNPSLALEIAMMLHRICGSAGVEIQLVDERGTSNLSGRSISSDIYGREKGGKLGQRMMRDQRAARLIAFREGRDFRQAYNYRPGVSGINFSSNPMTS